MPVAIIIVVPTANLPITAAQSISYSEKSSGSCAIISSSTSSLIVTSIIYASLIIFSSMVYSYIPSSHIKFSVIYVSSKYFSSMVLSAIVCSLITLSSTYTLLLERLSVSLPHPTNDCMHIVKTNNAEHSLFILYLMFFPIL